MSQNSPMIFSDPEILLPSDSGVHTMTTLAISTAAANLDLNGTISAVANRLSAGGAFFTIEAVTANAFVLAKATATTAAGTTSLGTLVAAGTTRDFWIEVTRPVLDVIASTTGVLKVYMSSRNIAKGI